MLISLRPDDLMVNPFECAVNPIEFNYMPTDVMRQRQTAAFPSENIALSILIPIKNDFT